MPMVAERPIAVAAAVAAFFLLYSAPNVVQALRYSSGNSNSNVLQHRQQQQQQQPIAAVELPMAEGDEQGENLASISTSRILQEIIETEELVEDVFRRLGGLVSRNSFLDQQLHRAYATSDGTSSTTRQHHDYYYQTDVAMPQAHGKRPPPHGDYNETDYFYGYGDDDYYTHSSSSSSNHYHGKSNKSSKSDKKHGSSKKHKKEKKYRGETKNIDKKLAKDGYFDDDMWNAGGGEPEDMDWHFNEWAWEYDEEWMEEEESYHESTSSSWHYDEDGNYRVGDAATSLTRSGPPGSKNRDDFNNANATDFDNDDLDMDSTFDMGEGLQGRSFGNYAGVEEEQQDATFGAFNVPSGKTKQLQMPDQQYLPKMDHIGPATVFPFNFPKIQHRVYSGPVLLKAHSAYDLSEMDPEIFAVLQSVLTPYLQAEVGSTLQAYTLEVDYSPGTDKVAEGMVVTNLQVTVTLKVLSNSIASLTSIDHTQASEWVREFFDGPELYQFITALGDNNIPINEIVFMEQDFKSPMNTGGQVIAGIEGNGGGNKRPTSSGGGSNGAVIGITIATLAVGCVLLLHFTGKLPSRESFDRFYRTTRESLSSGTRSYDGDDFDLGDALADIHNVEEGKRKRRDRTWSGTFRRFPTGGVRPAAIQKEPARSEDYLGDSSSKGSSSRSSSSNKVSTSSSSSKDSSVSKAKRLSQPSAAYDDYSFSVDEDYNVKGDYGPMTPKTLGNRRNMLSPNGSTPSGRSEFSMPEEYDTVAEEQASLYSKWSHSVMGRQQPPPVVPGSFGMSPLPASPRRVTPADIGSVSSQRRTTGGGLGDEWSLASFDAKSPSARQMYRDFNGSAAGSTSDYQREEKQSPSTWSKWGLSIPKFT